MTTPANDAPASLVRAEKGWRDYLSGDEADVTPELRAAFGEMSVREVWEFLASLAHEARQLRHAVQVQQRGLAEAAAELETLTTPPRPVARLLAVDAAASRARVALSPQQIFEVGIDRRLPLELLRSGQDVVLSAQRTCVLRALPPSDEPTGQERICELQSWLAGEPAGDATGERLHPALVLEAGREVVALVPDDLVPRIAQAGEGPVRLLVDGFGQVRTVFALDSTDVTSAARRFELALEAYGDDRIVGLHTQRRRVADAVARVPGGGAFVLCEGPPGSGKSLLARYALHLLQGRGETTVLTLRPTSAWRYYGQVEADVQELVRCAEGLARRGRQVLVFLDEIDTQFFTSRLGHSVHDNATRGTWLRLLGGEADLRGILVYATTNKAAHLPDELINRATQIVSFAAPSREQAQGLLDMYLAAPTLDPVARAALLGAAVGFLYDDGPSNAVAVAVLRDRSEHAVHPGDLRQLSARFFKELAWRIDATASERGVAPSIEMALAVTAERLGELVRGLALTPDNLGERTFFQIDPRNPVETVRLLPSRASELSVYRYQPLELVS